MIRTGFSFKWILTLSMNGLADAASIQELEAVQNRAIRFVKSIKGRHGITEGRTALGLQELKDRRKSQIHTDDKDPFR